MARRGAARSRVAQSGLACYGKAIFYFKGGNMATRLHPLYKQAVIDIVTEFSYGDVISHDWLKEAMELQPPGNGSFMEYQAFEFQYLKKRIT